MVGLRKRTKQESIEDFWSEDEYQYIADYEQNGIDAHEEDDDWNNDHDVNYYDSHPDDYDAKRDTGKEIIDDYSVIADLFIIICVILLIEGFFSILFRIL